MFCMHLSFARLFVFLVKFIMKIKIKIQLLKEKNNMKEQERVIFPKPFYFDGISVELE
jgi:hypothetical protein